MGQTMAHWDGDWGFKVPCLTRSKTLCHPVLLIDGERNSPLPLSACRPPAESPCNDYELIKLELFYFMTNYEEAVGKYPTDEELRLEACRIIFASEVLSEDGIASHYSWLRDLLMASEVIARQAQYGPLRSTLENRLAILKINGKDQLFDQCPMELELQDYVRAASFLITNQDLQKEATRIIRCAETSSTTPWGAFADWLVRIINSSADWLFQFRQRATNQKREISDVTLGQPHSNAAQTNTLYNTHENPFVNEAISPHIPDIQAITNSPLPHSIHLQDSSAQPMPSFVSMGIDDEAYNDTMTGLIDLTVPSEQDLTLSCPAQTVAAGSAIGKEKGKNPAVFFPNDANAYDRLARELSRFVKTTISPHNPFQHIPTDEELQHQARVILYDE
ncbi:hypothetical protein N7535_000800 [Penicillium sp. DV-2018c]|nr:hypothetical protein N7535_000800 [Penicillium sp. DV-2018c]